jgi:hypothetical protein
VRIDESRLSVSGASLRRQSKIEDQNADPPSAAHDLVCFLAGVSLSHHVFSS